MYGDVGGYITCCGCTLEKRYFHPLRSLAWAAYYFISFFICLIDVPTWGKIKWPSFLKFFMHIGSSITSIDPKFYSYVTAISHLMDHIAVDHKVERSAISLLRKEMNSKHNFFTEAKKRNK